MWWLSQTLFQECIFLLFFIYLLYYFFYFIFLPYDIESNLRLLLTYSGPKLGQSRGASHLICFFFSDGSMENILRLPCPQITLEGCCCLNFSGPSRSLLLLGEENDCNLKLQHSILHVISPLRLISRALAVPEFN